MSPRQYFLPLSARKRKFVPNLSNFPSWTTGEIRSPSTRISGFTKLSGSRQWASCCLCRWFLSSFRYEAIHRPDDTVNWQGTIKSDYFYSLSMAELTQQRGAVSIVFSPPHLCTDPSRPGFCPFGTMRNLKRLESVMSRRLPTFIWLNLFLALLVDLKLKAFSLRLYSSKG